MGKYVWRTTIQDDIKPIADGMRQADRDEMDAIVDMATDEALYYSISISTKTWTCLVDGHPCAMFGVAPCQWNPALGVVWMFGTPDVEKYPRDFFLCSQQALADMFEVNTTLINYVDCRNKKSIKWLKWLGALLDEARPYGRYGLPFHFFVLRGV